MCEKFVHKHSETIEYVRENFAFLRLRKKNFQGFVFTSTQTYREIFKSALVYL